MAVDTQVGANLLKSIENRCAHILTKLQEAADIILTSDFKPLETERIAPTIYDIEAYTQHWAYLVPDDPDVKAAVLLTLGEKYDFTPGMLEQAEVVLWMNNPAVRSAYERAAGKPFDTIFSAEPPPQPESDDPVRRDVLKEVEWLYLRRGETLFRQGEVGDYLYGVIDGLLRVHINKPDAEPFIGDVLPGQLVGEMAVITGEQRSGTVYAMRDSDMFRLSPEGYNRLAETYPQHIIKFTVQTIQRIYEATDPKHHIALMRNIAVLPIHNRNANGFTRAFVEQMRNEGQVMHLHRGELAQDVEDHVDEFDFVDWLQRLEITYDFVIYEGDPDLPNWTRRAIEQADLVLLVAYSDDDPALSRAESLLTDLFEPEFRPPCELVLLHESEAIQGTRDWLVPRDVRRHHHIVNNSDIDFARMIRFIHERAIGVAFGGGGMRASAHVGAIQALHEAGIHADYVGGTSAGAIVAAEYALGWDIDTMVERTRETLMQRRVLVNFTLPFTAMNSAYRLSQAYQDLFGNQTIEDQKVHSFYISGNWTQAKMVAIERGLIRRAVRASTSLVGIHPPIPWDNGDLMIDGGIFNNTPADVMRQRVGGGTVIAVDLGFTARPHPHYAYGEYLNGFRVLWHRINPFTAKFPVPGLFGLVMRANALGSIDATASQVAQADLILEPPVSDYGLFDLDAYDDVYQAGYDHTKERVRTWLDVQKAG